MADQIYVGRRKTSVARVILRSGNGKITVNGKEFEKAFPQLLSREDITLLKLPVLMMYWLMLTVAEPQGRHKLSG